jgi:hypothetical protein
MRLALIPVGVAIAFGILLLPRRATPEQVPLPVADARGLARALEVDDALAARARRDPLSGPVRALGSALRDFHSLEAREADGREVGAARQAIDAALIEALPLGDEGLLELRSLQLDAFMTEVQRFESTGIESAELHAVAGGFIRSMRGEGWCEGHSLAPSPPALRAMFKRMWNGLIGADRREAFRLSLDEDRALYAFYLSRPRPSHADREAISAARRSARDAAHCHDLDLKERAAAERLRLEHIDRLSAVDPAYPSAYAHGVASYRRGDFRGAMNAFRTWLGDHPDGPLALRARSYLRSAVDALPPSD